MPRQTLSWGNSGAENGISYPIALTNVQGPLRTFIADYDKANKFGVHWNSWAILGNGKYRCILFGYYNEGSVSATRQIWCAVFELSTSDSSEDKLKDFKDSIAMSASGPSNWLPFFRKLRMVFQSSAGEVSSGTVDGMIQYTNSINALVSMLQNFGQRLHAYETRRF